jgi:hypothetical protein
MGFEPNAARRLRAMWATTSDPSLRHDLSNALQEFSSMSFVPSADLRRQIALCPACELRDPSAGREGLCDSHRFRWNLELCAADTRRDDTDEALDRIMQGVLASETSGRELLSAIDRQLRALALVWEAHERGAVQLPERIAESVRLARQGTPRFLPAAPRRPVQQAS